MTNSIRNLPTKIVTVAVRKKDSTCKGAELIHAGWKVYINGKKYPEKPHECYEVDEETAIGAAIIAHNIKHGVV